MKMERPIVAIDVESTGADACEDAIFEFAAVILSPDGTRKSWSMNFKPWKPISEGASEVTGRKTEEFDDCPPFSAYAERIAKAMTGKDILAYSGRRFDLVILDQELRRSNFKLDLTGIRVIDPQVIYFKKEERDLSAAVRRFCGRDHQGAHGARADAEAALDVFFGQRTAFEDVFAMSLDELHAYSIMGDHEPVDLGGKFYRDAAGDMRFAFGKNKDQRVADQFGYCSWMLQKGSFPGSTLDALEAELSRLEQS
jgi:DNA polymerase-3 subunit epsilon